MRHAFSLELQDQAISPTWLPNLAIEFLSESPEQAR